MKSSDLRIGNYVIQSDKETIVNKLSRDIKDWDRVNNLRLLDSEPIPITEEWLIKFGFEYYKPLNHYRIVINDVWYSVQINYKNLKGFWFTFVNLNVDETIYMPYKNVDYVHELQNLFYCLTGSDLIIKENETT